MLFLIAVMHAVQRTSRLHQSECWCLPLSTAQSEDKISVCDNDVV